MESNNIELLLEKYFQGGISTVEENELRDYFSSPDVAPHLERYKPMFDYSVLVKDQQTKQEIPLQSKKHRVMWLSIAASVVVLLGIGIYLFYNNANEKQDLGTYDDPEVAFAATQKALELVSNNLNVGIKSVYYIQEYQNTKELIFK